MAVLPVIERELRAQSRSRFTYLIRVLAASAVIAVCVHFSLRWGLLPTYGRLLFAELHGAVFASIWLLVPLFTADCISNERREGTLGLLFLTPLNSSGIVLAKGVVHGLRALTLWLAVLPILTVSFLVGGVSWVQMIASVFITMSAICMALAAGVLASSFAKRWGHALLLSSGIAVIFFSLQVFMTGWFYVLANAMIFSPRFGGSEPGFFDPDRLQMTFEVGAAVVTGIQSEMRALFVATPRPAANGILVHAGVLLFAVCMLGGIIQLAAWNVRRVWHEEPPSARQQWLEKKLVTPVIGVNFLRAWLKRKLDRNPVGWLEQRSWSGRIVTWGWFAVMISFYSVAFRGDNIQKIILGVQQMMPVGMLIVMSGVACGSFQRERETRVLELLLISPMKAHDIIAGRLRGLWGQFIPCLALMLFVQASFQFMIEAQMEIATLIYYCSSYFALPVIGLYYSLKSSNFMTAFLSTLIVGLAFPSIVPSVIINAVDLISWMSGFNPAAGSASQMQFFLHFIFSLFAPLLEWSLLPTVIQVAMTFYLGLKLHRNLVRRNFAFVKAAT